MMYELVDPLLVPGDHICSKCWMIEELGLKVDDLESELQMLRHISKGENCLDAVLLEGVTPVRLTASNLVRIQEEGVTASEAGRGIEVEAVLEETQPLRLSSRSEILTSCADEYGG